MRPGSLVVCNSPNSPAWLSMVKVVKGDADGFTTFLLTTEPEVQPDLKFPDLSRWTCSAVPVESGGSGLLSRKSAKAVVVLSGELCSDWLNPEPDPLAALMRVVRASRTLTGQVSGPLPVEA